MVHGSWESIGLSVVVAVHQTLEVVCARDQSCTMLNFCCAANQISISWQRSPLCDEVRDGFAIKGNVFLVAHSSD